VHECVLSVRSTMYFSLRLFYMFTNHQHYVITRHASLRCSTSWHPPSARRQHRWELIRFPCLWQLKVTSKWCSSWPPVVCLISKQLWRFISTRTHTHLIVYLCTIFMMNEWTNEWMNEWINKLHDFISLLIITNSLYLSWLSYICNLVKMLSVCLSVCLYVNQVAQIVTAVHRDL